MTTTLAFPDDDPHGVRHGYEAEGHAATTAALQLNGPIKPVPYFPAATSATPTREAPSMNVGQRVENTITNRFGTAMTQPYVADNAMFLVVDVRWDNGNRSTVQATKLRPLAAA